MKISTKERYALRAMLELAGHHGEGYMSLNDIAASQQISLKYLEQVFSVLRKKDLILSEKGAQGGYKLKSDPSMITVADIINAFGSEIDVAPGTLYSVYTNGTKSLIDEFIELEIWSKINEKLNEIAEDATLKSLLLKGECRHE